MAAQSDPESFDPQRSCNAAPAALSQADHLLRVAASVTRDANTVWADLWAELRPHVTPGGAADAELQKQGFIPSCGWAEFLEKYWLLKHYLDSIDRICRGRH